MFARADTNELRGECPKNTLCVLDAVAIARGCTRTALVNEILGQWAAAKQHEASLVQKLAGVIPTTSERTGGAE